MTGSVGERFLDNQKIDGTLPQMLKDALFFVRKNMKKKLFEGRMTIAYIMTKYIHPMTEKGIIALAIPDKPKSKKQKYFAQN